MNQEQPDQFITKFIKLTVRTIYRHKIDVGPVRWIFLVLNFLYINSLLSPMTKIKAQYTSNYGSEDINSSVINQITWREGYKIFFIAARPTQILNFNEDNTYNLFLSIIIMITLFIMIFGILYISLYTSCNNSKQFFFMKHVLFVANIFNYFFMMLATEILVSIGIHGGFGNAVNGSFASNTSSELGARVISIISLPLVYLFSIFSLLFGEQCITHEEYGLFRNNSNSIISILIVNIKFVLAFIIGADPNYVNASTSLIISLIAVVFVLLSVYEFYFYIPFSSFTLQNVYYLLINQTLIMIVIEFLSDYSYQTANSDYTLNIIQPNMVILLLLIISIIYQNLSFSIWRQQKIKILLSNTSKESTFQKSDHKYITKRINMLIMNQKFALENQHIYYIGIFNRHQKFCLDKYCFCHQQQMMKGEQNSQLLLNNRAYEQLIRMYIRNDLRLIDVFNVKEDSYQFLRYMDHFLYVKKHTFALYKIIDIQIEQEKMKKQLNVKASISLSVMLEILKETMSGDIRKGTVDLTVEQTSKAIEIYIQMENLKSILKVMIYKCLEIKKDTLDQMKKSFEFSQQVEDLNCKYIQQIDTTEVMLVDFYNRFTTPLNQQLLIFFEAEIKGNLKKAHYVKQTHKQSDIAEYLNSKNMFIDVFSQEVISITATVGKKLGRIVGYSDKAPAVFGYKKQEFDYITDIKDLMPVTLAKLHDEVVRFMMIRGKYNVVHIARTVFLRNKNNFIFQVNIFADINFFYAEELPFIFMAKVIKTNSAFFIVNHGGRIEGICQNFFAKICQHIESLPFMFKVDIQYIVPKFDELITTIKPFQKQEFNEVDLNFPETKSTLFNDLFYKNKSGRQNFTSQQEKQDQNQGMMQLDSMRSQMSQVRQKLNQKDNDILKFKTDISIQKRILGTTKGDLTYYVIEFKSVILQSKYKNGMTNSLNNSTNFSIKNLNKQKSTFSKVDKESFQQVQTLNSSEQFDEDINPPKSTYAPEATIAESEGESMISSTSVGVLNLQSQDKKNNQIKKKKQSKRKKKDDILVDTEKQNLNESTTFMLTQRNVLEPQINNTPAQTNRSMLESEIMVEHRFITLQETQQGQAHTFTDQIQVLDKKTQSNSNKGAELTVANGNFTPQSFSFQQYNNNLNESQRQLLVYTNNDQQEKQLSNPAGNEINIDINDINYTIHDSQHQKSPLKVDSHKSPKGKGDSSKSIKGKGDTKSQKTIKSQKTSNKNNNNSNNRDSAKERFKLEQSKLQRKKSSMNDNSMTKTESKEGLGEQLKAGSSINGDESDKIRQIDKFSYFEAFTEQKAIPQSLQFLKFLKFFEFSTMIATSIIIATSINNFLSSFISSADGILFRSYIMMPYSSFTSAEFLMRQIKTISSYPNQGSVLATLDNYMNESFTQLYSNMTKSYQESSLISDFADQYINIINPYLLNATSENLGQVTDLNRLDQISSNFTFVDSLGQLIYHLNTILGIDLAQAATSNSNQIQSILFVEHNYQNFFDRCLEFIQEQLNSNINMKDNLNLIIIIVSTLMVIFTFIVYVVVILNYMIFQQRMVQILDIITTVKNSSVENEIIRVIDILESLKENEDIIEKYVFSIRQKEYLLAKFSDDEEQYQLSQDQRKRKNIYVKINQQKLSNLRFYVVSSLTMLLFFIYILVNLFVNISFLNTYKPALDCLNDFGRMNFEIPSLLTYTNIMYQYNLNNQQMFGADEINLVKSNFNESLQFVTDFAQSAYTINQLSFFSSSFVNSLYSDMQSNLCNYYPQLDSSVCTKLFNAGLTQGLVNALSQWKEVFIQTQNIDFKITNNSDFYANQVLLLQFGQVLNASMVYFTSILYKEVQTIIQNQQNLVLLFAIMFSIIITLPKLYELTLEYNSILRRFFMAKKIVFMLPLYTLMIEETFNKMLKAIGNKLNIKK